MASNALCGAFFRIVLPLSLLAACLIRFNGLSLVYLICLLIVPLLPRPSRQKLGAIRLQKAVLFVSVVSNLAHLCFQVTLLAMPPYGYFIKPCTFQQKISEHMGFHRFDNCKVEDIIRLLVPDIIVFIVSLTCVLLCRKLTAPIIESPSRQQFYKHIQSPFSEILPFLVALSLLICGIIQPNALAAIYFLAFLVMGTFWAAHRSLKVQKNTCFLCLKIALLIYTSLHVILLYIYQMDFFQEIIVPGSLAARLTGLPAIIHSTCHSPESLTINRSLSWPYYVSPVITAVLYFVMATELRWTYSKNLSVYDDMSRWNQGSQWSHQGASEDQRLVQTPNRANYLTFHRNDANDDVIPEEPALRITGDDENANVNIQGTFSSIMMFMMRQSYIASLIIMMAWSITYHSWLTFVLLLWACLTWITPFARWFCMVSSPYLVFYAECLLLIQYVYGFDLGDEYLPTKEGNVDFSELGLKRWQFPCLHLGAQTLFTWVFWITLRQHVREKKMKRRQGSAAGELVLSTIARPIVQAFKRRVIGHDRKEENKKYRLDSDMEEVDAGPPSDDAKEFMHWVKGTLAKYWIVVCCGAFLLVALQNNVSIYQIVYMVMFLIVFITYQFSIRVWQVILRPIWWSMVVYSIIILLVVYTYQFENMHSYWSHGTHLTDKWLYDLGLRQHTKATLLLNLLIPTIFSIVVVIQLHFFHKPLMMKINRLAIHRHQQDSREKIRRKQQRHQQVDIGIQNHGDGIEQTDCENEAGMSSAVPDHVPSSATESVFSDTEPETHDHDTSQLVTIVRCYSRFTYLLWRFGEIHCLKIVSLVVIFVVVQQVSAINALFILLLAIAMPSERVQKAMNYVLILWSAIVILVLMFYQLQFVKEDLLRTNCTGKSNVTLPDQTNHFSSNAWWIGFHKSDDVSTAVRGYLLIVLAIVFSKLIKHHQELERCKKMKSEPPAGILFENITRQKADENIRGCLKYLCNHFFELFGFEINLIVMVTCLSYRSDAIAVIYSLWVIPFLMIRRKHTQRLWPFYVGFLALMLPLQYFLTLGWPPGLCYDYPWTGKLGRRMIRWLYLTDVLKSQNQYFLLADFFQLLFACRQEVVFTKERYNKRSQSTSGGGNEEERMGHAAKRERDQYMPPDFMVNNTWLDFIKILILEQFYWLTLSIVYITAQSTTSLFNSGFILGCFFYLWHGQSLYLRPRHTMRKWWKIFIGYNFFVIVAKVWLQFVSCVWINTVFEETGCYIIQLLNLYCLHGDSYNLSKVDYEDDLCAAQEDTGLAMDCVCFVFALFQYRIFKSVYFKYVIREHRRQSEMADRGAQLVEEHLDVRLQESIQKDRSKMNLIKSEVGHLKRKLNKLNPKAEEPLSHYEAVYSGDYYLFESERSEDDDDFAIVQQDGTTRSSDTPPLMEEASSAVGIGNGTEQDSENLMLTEESGPSSTVSSQAASPIEIRRGDLRKRHRRKTKRSEPIPRSSLAQETQTSPFETEETTDVKYCEKLRLWVTNVATYFHGVAENLISFFDEVSSDYRTIASQLERERRDRARIRGRSLQSDLVGDSANTSAIGTSERVSLASGSMSLEGSGRKSADDDKNSRSDSSVHDSESDTWSMVTADDEMGESWRKQDAISVRFSVAFYYALLAKTDLLCYALMIINHMYYACILSIPLPFFVFLWGMLSIPRPTKRFWISVITYVELVIVVKYIFQFQFFEFNDCNYYELQERDSPLCPPRIIGIERNAYSSVCDLMLLLALFFHRFALKAHGLWREKQWNTDEEDHVHGHPSHTEDETQSLLELPATINYTDVTSLRSSPDRKSSLAPSIGTQTMEPPKKRGVIINMKRFVERMLDPCVGTGAVDVYALMFGCQFFVFVIITVSWSAFSSPEATKSNFTQIIEENVVPKTFLYMLLTQFFLIVIDRYLYLRKFVFAKLLYLAFLVFLFHIFMFFIVPDLTVRRFIANIPAIFMYLFQCIYFGLSAYQVRCGYPTRILGNFLTKNFTLTSGVLFQGIQSIPFLLELRSVLDWVCTDTTLTLSHWLKMEDIYANIYILKCWRDSEKTWPHPRGMKYWATSKWLLGGILVTLLIVVIWFPLLFMSFISSAYISNLPVDATVTVSIGGYQPLFKISAQQQFLTQLSKEEISIIKSSDHSGNLNWDESKVDTFLQEYQKRGNIVRVQITSNSSAVWAISPPSRDVLVNDLKSNRSITMRFKYEFNREPSTSMAALVQETVTGVNSVPLKPGNHVREKLAEILSSPTDGGEVVVKALFPSFVQVPASGPARPVLQLGGASYVTCAVRLRKGKIAQINSSIVEWWELIQLKPKPIYGPAHDNSSLEMLTFNDLVPPMHLSFFASNGIIGLYVGFVWLIGKFVRLFFTSISYRIIFDEMPNVDKVLKLCLQIYMVRESKELELEEDLFAKLIFLYRSPETIIKWTKYKRH